MRLALCCCGTTVRQIWPVCLLFPFLVALPVRDCRSACRSWPVSRASPCCCASPRSSSVPAPKTSVLRWLFNRWVPAFDRQENRPCLYTLPRAYPLFRLAFAGLVSARRFICFRGHGGSRLHYPITDHIPQRPGGHSCEHIHHVVVPSPHCRNTHAGDQRQHYPEQPPPVTPCSPQRRDRPGHVLRWKGRPAHATEMFNAIDGCRDGPALQRAVPRSGHRKPWTFDGKENRDQITDCVPRGRIRHHRPVLAPIAPVIQDATQHQQISETSKISELHEIVARRRCKLFQPQTRIDAGQPVIGSHQLRVLPAWRHEMHEFSQLLKTEQKKQM